MRVVSKSKYIARYFGPFRIATNLKEEEFEIDGIYATINDLINQIVKKYNRLEESFYINGDLNNNVNVVINGDDIRSKNGLKTKISPKDRITFFKGVGGG